MMLKLVAALILAAAAAAPVEMVTSVSSPMNDYNLSYDAAQRHMVFARSEADFKNARVFYAARRRLGWPDPKPISFTDPRFADSDPWLTPDGRTLYFISDRPAPGRDGDRKDYDIWRSVRTSGGWSAPERLGDAVNSKGPELGVEFHDDALYFASARKGGKGGLDIYVAELGKSGFAPARLLDGPFNSPSSDSDFTLSANGRTAVFWRSVGDKGVLHISRRARSGWSDPVPLPVEINRGPFNYTPSFSRNGQQLWFASTAEREGQEKGLSDIFVARLPD